MTAPFQRRARLSRTAALVVLAAGCTHARLDAARFGGATDDPVKRATGLVAALTLDEKVAQLQNAAPAIPRLGIPAYDWWSESLHGVARNGTATVFPQAIGLAATFDEDLLRRIGRAIADEARAKFAAAGGALEGSGRYQGLTFFAPNVNIFRDPRWGRGQETYGEDPLLTARLGVAYVQGMQGEGDDRRQLRVAAVGKHFAVHSGPELDRHRFDARVDAHDLADTYLPQFEALVREAHVSGIMAAYNRVNGQPCVASDPLLGQTLRGRWGFDGFVVGDCGAVGDLVSGHAVAPDAARASALALRAGTDLDCGRTYGNLLRAVAGGLVTEAELDRALVRLFSVRFRLGLFDPVAQAPSSSGKYVPPDAHRALAREAAQKSLVLLENDDALPIGSRVRRIAVVGPNADDREVLLGNYHGDPVAPVTILAGIRAAAADRGITVDATPGVTLATRSMAGLPAALAAARAADLVVAVLGLSPKLEGEEGDPDGANPSGDRRDLNLPGIQGVLLANVLATKTPVVVVLTGGSSVELPPSSPRPRAVLMAWYPGEQGGTAVADVLFGDVAPSGRLPVTFYRSVADLPPFTDYAMAGRTYRYFRGTPRYPFGHGLGYSPITVAGLSVDDVASGGGGVSPAPGGAAVSLHVVLENPGARAVNEVLPVYASARERAATDPLRALVGFRRVPLAPGERRTIEFVLPASAFTRVDDAGQHRAVDGEWDLSVGPTSIVVHRP